MGMDGQEYAQVKKMLGNGRLEAFCFDGKTRLCHIRGKMRKRIWIGVGDFILLALREFQDRKADVILKYTDEGQEILRFMANFLIWPKLAITLEARQKRETRKHALLSLAIFEYKVHSIRIVLQSCKNGLINIYNAELIETLYFKK